MIYKVRERANGTEYWDNKTKRSLFVKRGDKPDFEYSEKGITVHANNEVAAVVEPETVDLDSMSLAQLNIYAKDNDITIPKDVTKKHEIVDFLKANG